MTTASKICVICHIFELFMKKRQKKGRGIDATPKPPKEDGGGVQVIDNLLLPDYR